MKNDTRSRATYIHLYCSSMILSSSLSMNLYLVYIFLFLNKPLYGIFPHLTLAWLNGDRHGCLIFRHLHFLNCSCFQLGEISFACPKILPTCHGCLCEATRDVVLNADAEGLFAGGSPPDFEVSASVEGLDAGHEVFRGKRKLLCCLLSSWRMTGFGKHIFDSLGFVNHVLCSLNVDIYLSAFSLSHTTLPLLP